ncbi:MAG TPA: SoxR reducing system RseC family protein [Methylophilaceae bacterium]|jgi:sigma-E factor negative regulatory protein RseC
MIEEQAVIVELKGERALLEIERSQPCGICGATRGCGISIWGRFFSQRSNKFLATNQLNAKIGDRVVVGVEEGALFSSAMISYVVPLALLIGGALLGSSMATTTSTSDLYATLGGVIGLFAGLLLVKAYSSGKQLSGRYAPVMLRRATVTAEPIPL